ncbi:hypothetical protein NDU88_005369 [Pleurodeles waltl]|uniref:Secreted protein n=1 Tax=Pleurodeles waltl TaxID=8319 RepID=A0AAV7NRB4_PLEWA|nr:hypothetical protein NDU88_005369 [Pleurodeles waltl]
MGAAPPFLLFFFFTFFRQYASRCLTQRAKRTHRLRVRRRGRGGVSFSLQVPRPLTISGRGGGLPRPVHRTGSSPRLRRSPGGRTCSHLAPSGKLCWCQGPEEKAEPEPPEHAHSPRMEAV